jgi:hypothetical protein
MKFTQKPKQFIKSIKEPSRSKRTTMLSALWFNEAYFETTIKLNNNNILLESCSDDKKTISNLKRSTLALPIDKFNLHNTYIPQIKGENLEKAIELQVEICLGSDYKNKFEVVYFINQLASGHSLFILGLEKKEIPDFKVTAIIPEGVSLVLYAIFKKLITLNDNSLLLYYYNERLLTTVIEAGKIVFIREQNSIKEEELRANLKHSSQSYYLQYERHYIDVDNIIIFSNTHSLKNQISAVFTKEHIKTTFCDLNEFIDQKTNKCNFIGVASALFAISTKNLKKWSVINKGSSGKHSLKRLMISIGIILVILLPLYNYSEYYKFNSDTNKVKNIIKLYHAQLSEVISQELELKNKETYMHTYGNKVLSYFIIYDFFNVFNKCRSDNIKISNFQAKEAKYILISGSATAYSEVSDLIKKLKLEKELINNIKLNYSTEPKTRNVTFNIEIELNERTTLANKLIKKDLIVPMKNNKTKNNA